MDIAQHFISEARNYLSATYLPKIESCLESLADEDVWRRANAESNSIGNLLLHLNGSTRMWIVSGVGGAGVLRDRQQEFDERELIPRAELIARLKATVAEADGILANVDREELLRRRQIRGEEVSGLEAIFHAVEHFSMHTGQIIMLTKMRTGKDLKLTG